MPMPSILGVVHRAELPAWCCAHVLDGVCCARTLINVGVVVGEVVGIVKPCGNAHNIAWLQLRQRIFWPFKLLTFGVDEDAGVAA